MPTVQRRSADLTCIQAAAVKFEKCKDSNSYIRIAQVAFVDGLFTVTIDINLETEKGNFDLYVFTPGHFPAEESLLKSTEFCGIFPFVLSPHYCT